MFETKYKEACESMKLSDSFKTGLVNMMKKESKKAVPKKRLILATITAVILVSTSVVFATNYATDGQLFKNVLSGFGYDPQTTKSSMTVATETTGEPTAVPACVATVTPTTEPKATATATPTAAVTPTVTPTVKPTTVPTERIAPTVTAVAGANSVTVSWTKITSPDLVGYKVVASKSDSTPKYSENGYYKWITDAGTTSCTISNGAGYNGGDISTFSGGTSYYFSVTAVYGEEWQTVAGNAVAVTMPGAAAETTAATTVPAETTAAATAPTGRIAPSVNAVAGTNSVTVTWNKIDSPDLVGYKVVASKSCATPKYSENGYYEWVTDLSRTSCTINVGAGYHDGDVGTFSGGTSYYFSVTAIYGSEWQKIAGNAVQVTMPGTAPTATPTPVPTVAPTCQAAGNISATAEAGGVRVSWTPITDATGFNYYKIVVAFSNSSPAYPGDGYYTYICDSSASSCLVGSGNTDYGLNYNAGSEGFSALTPGQTYYFSVTTVYTIGEDYIPVAGTAQQAVMP